MTYYLHYLLFIVVRNRRGDWKEPPGGGLLGIFQVGPAGFGIDLLLPRLTPGMTSMAFDYTLLHTYLYRYLYIYSHTKGGPNK